MLQSAQYILNDLEVIEEADRDNVGLVLDFWHLWAGGKTTPADVAKLDKNNSSAGARSYLSRMH